MSEVPTERIDGRTARRERGRRAVLETALQLLASEDVVTTEKIASEAGISTSSFFRYFERMEELYREMAELFAERHADLFEAAPTPGADRAQRVSEFVALRWRNCEIIAPLARRVEAFALTNPEALPVTISLRRRASAHVERFFGPELGSLTSQRRIDLASTIDVLLSVEAGRTLVDVHERTPHQVRRSWTAALTALLETVDPDEPHGGRA